jgi:primosomal replication protein N
MIKEPIKCRYTARAYEVSPSVSRIAQTLENRELNEYLDRVLHRDSSVVWLHSGDNLVTDVGARWLINHSFVTPQASIPWYLILKSAGTGDNADTVASHASWTEITGYSQASRQLVSIAAITSGRSASNTASMASITANASITVAGFALISANTKGNTTAGVLFSVSDFASSWAGTTGNILRVTVTVSA